MRRALLTSMALLFGTLCAPGAAVADDYGPGVCAEYAHGAGFRGDRLVKAIAIGMAESGCRTWAKGPNPADQGAWQVRATPERVARYGDLLVPENNARAAFDLSGQGTNWQTHWPASNCGDASNRACYAHWLQDAKNAAKWWTMPDVNGDTYGDVVGVDGNGQLFGYNNASLVSSDGRPFTGETWRVPGSDWSAVNHLVKGDVNADGYADLVAATSDGRLVVYNNGSLVHPGGQPYLGITWTYHGDWGNVRQLAIGDVTGDLYADLVVVESDGTLVVYANGSHVNPGGAPFSNVTYRFGNWGAVRKLTVTDVNHDGAADIVAVDGNGQLFGYNNGSRVNPGNVPFSGETWRLPNSDWSGVLHLTSGDVNSDLWGDLIAVEADGSLSIYGNGSLVNPNGVPFGGRTWRIAGNWSPVREIA